MRPVSSAICTSAEPVSVSWRRCSLMVAVLSAMTSFCAPCGRWCLQWSIERTGGLPGVRPRPAVGGLVAAHVGGVELERRRQAVHERARAVQRPLDLLDGVLDADRRPLDGEREADDVAE